MNIGVILAAGSGSRMETALPKQFLELESKPILIHSVAHFVYCQQIHQIVVAVPRDYISYTEKLLEKYFPETQFFVICGGKDRSDTLVKLVDFIFMQFPVQEDTVLVTHDAVRPFISERILRDNIDAALQYGACNTVVPAVDTILSSGDGNFISQVFDRSTIYHAQTPQSFLAIRLRDLLNATSQETLSSLTDACSLFVLHHQPVKLVMGSRDNIKITYPNDLIHS